MTSRLASLDLPILAHIVGFCSASPSQKMNQVGNTCRRVRVAWARMKLDLQRRMMDSIVEMVIESEPARSSDILVVDLQDIM